MQKSGSGDQRGILKVYGMRGVHAKVSLRTTWTPASIRNLHISIVDLFY